MTRRLISISGAGLLLSLTLTAANAQDVPGIEICTVDKTMERRTSCLQSNVDFLVKTINRLRGEQEQKNVAANARIDMLNSTVAELQKTVAELHAAKKDAPAAEPIKPALDRKDAPVAKQ